MSAHITRRHSKFENQCLVLCGNPVMLIPFPTDKKTNFKYKTSWKKMVKQPLPPHYSSAQMHKRKVASNWPEISDLTQGAYFAVRK